MQCLSVIILCFMDVLASFYNWDILMPGGQGSHVLEYVFYTQQMTWNAARSTCQSIGGDLVTIDSPRTMAAIERTIDESDPPTSAGIFFSNYWVGLTEISKGTALWVANCSNLSYHELFETTWDANRMCYYMSGTMQRGFRAECNQTYPFMCQRRLHGKCSSFVTSMNVEYISSVWENGASPCDKMCLSDIRCIGIAVMAPVACLVLYKAESNVTSANLLVKAKSCIKGYDLMTTGRSVTNTPVPLTSSISQSTSSSNIPKDEYVDTSSPLNTNLLISGLSYTTTTGATEAFGDDANSFPSEVTSSTHCIHENKSSTVTLQSHTGETYVCNKLTPTNLTVNEIEEKAVKISQNLTIPTKETSAYLRTLTSAEDRRTSSVVMGTVGIICVTVPVALLILSDVKLLYDTILAVHTLNKPLTRHVNTKYTRQSKM